MCVENIGFTFLVSTEEPPLIELKIPKDEIPVEPPEPADDSEGNTDILNDEIPPQKELKDSANKLKMLKNEIAVENFQPVDDNLEDTETLEKDLDTISLGNKFI